MIKGQIFNVWINFVELYTSAGVQNKTMEASNNNDPKSIQHKEDKHPPRKPTKGDPSESGNHEVEIIKWRAESGERKVESRKWKVESGK